MYKCVLNHLKRSLVSRRKGSNLCQRNVAFLSLSPTFPFDDLAGQDILHSPWFKVCNCPPLVVCCLMMDQQVNHVISLCSYTCNTNYVQTLPLFDNVLHGYILASIHVKKHTFIGALIIQILICSSNPASFVGACTKTISWKKSPLICMFHL